MLQLTCYHQTGRLMISNISFLPLVGLYVSKTTSNMKFYVTVDFRVYVIQERERGFVVSVSSILQLLRSKLNNKVLNTCKSY